MQDRHKRAVKVLGYALVLAESKQWALTAEVWAIRLTPDERYAMALSALATLPPDDVLEAVTAALKGAGYPQPTFLDPLDDAQWWSDMATLAELRAYCFAAFMALPAHEKRDFLEFAKGEVG